MTKAVISAKLLLRNVYRCIKQKSTWQDNLVIDKATDRDLTWWWSALDHWNGRAFKPQCKEYVQMTTDASLEGWGSNLMIESGYQAQGFWDLDMKGEKLQSQRNNGRISFIDIISTKYQRQKCSGTDRQCIHRSIYKFSGWPKFRSVRSSDQNLVSRLTSQHYHQGKTSSRTFERSSRWTESDTRPVRVVDASPSVSVPGRGVGAPQYRQVRLNEHNTVSKVQQPVSRPFYMRCRSLHQSDWATENNFVNAPIRLLDRILEIIYSQKAYATVIAPAWRAKTWYQKLKELSIGPPIRLPQASQFCIPHSIAMPEALKNHRWAWYAWRICGQIS
ncbi:reverse transcriptase [Plakobranchus ocellatus]|uniref:Reverse transcriptase n=1 Tax=Plakobranchus ocellatus TaxID=259542 RepID=A0AAV3YRE8_9GAST|nr:reverse transcriptase [Plakobranchus ocellatus]